MEQMALLPQTNSLPAPSALSMKAVRRAPYLIVDMASKELARRHPGHMAEYVLDLKPEPFHWEWLELYRSLDRFVLKASRGHAKSTYFSIVNPLYEIGTDPNIRITIASATAGQSEKFLREVDYHIRFNKKYRAVFGDLYDSEAVWTQKQKTVKRSKALKDPTLLAVGVGTGFAGARTDILNFDDLVDDTNSLTKHRRAQVLNWVMQTALPTLDPLGPNKAGLVGTPYHFDDATLHLAAVWPSFEYPAEDTEGNILWPSRFNRAELDNRRKEAGEYIYNTQYLVRPVGLEGNRLLRVWLHESDYELPADSSEVWGVDWAVVPEDEDELHQRDYTVISKFRDAPWGLELFDVVRMQAALPDVIDYIAADIHPRVRVLGVEQNGVGKPAIQMLQRATEFPITPVLATGSKVTRFELMAPDFASKRITLAKNRTERVDQHFIPEWIGFPYFSNDDCLDGCDIARRAAGFGGITMGEVEF